MEDAVGTTDPVTLVDGMDTTAHRVMITAVEVQNTKTTVIEEETLTVKKDAATTIDATIIAETNTDAMITEEKTNTAVMTTGVTPAAVDHLELDISVIEEEVLHPVLAIDSYIISRRFQ